MSVSLEAFLAVLIVIRKNQNNAHTRHSHIALSLAPRVPPSIVHASLAHGAVAGLLIACTGTPRPSLTTPLNDSLKCAPICCDGRRTRSIFSLTVDSAFEDTLRTSFALFERVKFQKKKPFLDEDIDLCTRIRVITETSVVRERVEVRV